MKKVASTILAGSLLVLSVAGLCHAATIHVPDDYTTIQAAIDAAAIGDTVLVASGTYRESLGGWRDISITKSISLIGAGSGMTVVELSNLQHGVEIIPDATGAVLIQGIAFTKRAENAYSAGWGIIVGETGGTFHSLVFRDVEIAYASARNLHLASATYDYALLEDCDIHHAGAWGFSARGVLTSLVLLNSFFDYNGTADAAHGIGFDIDSPTTVTSVSVTGGSFSHNTAKGINLVKTNNASFTGITANSNGGAPGGGFGVCLWEWMGSSSNLSFESCSFENNATDGILFGTEGTCTIDGIAAHGCTITGNGRCGILFYHNLGGSASNIAVTGSYLAGNASGAIVLSALSVAIDASANWWGVATTDGVPAAAPANADYTPWLASGMDLSADPGFQADWSALWVDDDSPQTGAKGRVQEGVDLVSGSTVYLAPGTYEEQVEIAKTLTLDGGGGGGGIIKSPVELTKYFTTPSTKKPIVYIHDCDGVVIKDLTVDGAGRGNANVQFCGIAFWNAGGTVDGCVVKDVRDTPFSGVQHGVAIYSYSSGTTAYAVNVWDCEIYGFQKNAMALNAGDTNPFTVDVRRNVITGAGATTVTAQNGIQVWADLGSGTVADNVISGIAYDNTSSPTKWVATSILDYYADLEISGNTITGGHMGIYAIDGACDISGNELSVEKVGVSGYGICATDPPNAKPTPFGEEALFGASRRAAFGTLSTLDIDVQGNTVDFTGADNVNTIGVEVDAGYSDHDLDVTVNGNVVTDFDYGVEFWQCQTGCDPGTFIAIEARYNSIVGNTTMGMESNADYLVVNAKSNWWGDATGPYHPTLNPGGFGNDVSDYIDFDPYMGSPNEVSVTPAATLTNCTTPKTVTFMIDQTGVPTPVRGYEVQFLIDTAKVRVAAPASDIVEGSFLKSVGSTQFFRLGNGSGLYTVSCAILGATAGATGHGDLFSVLLTPKAEGTSAITIVSLKVRDLNNVPISSSAVGGTIRIDCSPPTMDAIAEAQGGWYNAAPLLSHVGFDDDLNLDLAEYRYDGGDWTAIFSGIDTASWDADPWTLPGWAGLSEGTHTIWFRVKDDAGNWNASPYSWQFYKDTIAPPPPTNFVAMPGNDKTHLSWTNPSDPQLAGVEIRFTRWNDYPEYEATAPVYPADHTAGTYVALATGTAFDDAPRTPRDIYYYAAFSKDLAGNYSTLGSTAYDRCTSYWLGDVIVDGWVNISDLAAFSGAFGTIEGGPGWLNTCDFGPTDDWSRFGVPEPDDAVDFEDLMIFAMNFHLVTPAGLSELAAAPGAKEDLAKVVGLDLVANDDGTYSLVLANRASTLKGLRVVAEVASGVLDRVSRGALFAGNGNLFFGNLFFGTVPATANTADISVAALGTGRPLAGSGEIARLAIRPDGEQPVRVRIVSLDLRDLDNARSEIVAAEEYQAPFVPKATALMQNFPNPFNPTTTVTFDLTAASRVRIDVYDVSGRLVAVLFDGTKGAGRHRVEWNGRDASGSLAPSGIYFYRMKTAGYEATRKMILVR